MMLRMLAFAVASNKMAYVFLIGDELKDWEISDAPRKSAETAIHYAERRIDHLMPDVIITEDVTQAESKGDYALVITNNISQLAEKRLLLNPRVKRQHEFANKYEEAQDIVERYPELDSWFAYMSRKFFNTEPRNTILFEAMSNALQILRNPSQQLGAAMG